MPDIEKLVWAIGGTILMALIALGFGLFAVYHGISKKFDKDRMLALTLEHQATEDRLEEAIRLVHIGALAGGASHYLNQILYAITALIEMIAKNNTNIANMRTLATLASEEAIRGLRITDQLQQVARPIQIRLDSMHITQVLDLVTAKGNMHRACVTEIESGLAQHTGIILGDPGLLKRLLELLLTNAADATENDGTISIHCYQEEVLKGNQFLVLKVSDTGTGMSEEAVQHATEPFFTTKRRQDRLGLGLSFALGLAKIHRGDLEIVSTINQGSTVKLILPFATREELENNAAKALNIDCVFDQNALSMEERLIAIRQEIGRA